MGFDLVPILLRGLDITVRLTLTSAAVALVIAMIAGLGRLSPLRPVRFLAGLYVEVFRGTSVLVQMFWFFFALPLFGVTLSPFVAGVTALSLNIGAYGAEIVRGSILSVPKGQLEASVALNMTPALRMRRVILPQALVLMMPPFGNLLIELLKATALVSLITIPDITFRGVTLQQTTGRTTEIFLWLLVLYFAIAYPMTLGVRWIERRASAFRKA
ncbi:ectoine/hydroxyectoine ABC transporter permease subunit EhuC [soil metagenome]|nr:ectoine/hydroxyectoine ABC transporter permease subunit EhuC [Trueperaceae bacterium]